MSIWKKMFGDSPLELSVSRTNNTDDIDRCYAFYVFANDGYRAETAFLKALSKVVGPDGRQLPLSPLISLMGCHGDLYEDAIGLIAQWIKTGTHGLDTALLDPPTLEGFKSGDSLGFIPYVVGIGTLQTDYARRVHEELKASGISDYHGLILPNAAPSLAQLARSLHLPCDLRVDAAKCAGWLTSADTLRGLGLYS